jgi:hypothetical protein
VTPNGLVPILRTNRTSSKIMVVAISFKTLGKLKVSLLFFRLLILFEGRLSTVYESVVHEVPTDHLLLDSAPNLGLLISRWVIDKVRKLLIQKCQNFRGSKAFV